ncbi:IS110 family transposase [Caballeronia mineralivorans]|jgi:transposase|uniref:IS110 family transposase n=1 Tax=Caballeronia mineralivorans TaxID=2010198 RepID=UPI0023F1AAFE|nr:IS110 family transposase [Caballeronia mineralivorans]MDB5786353.1 transposase family protein [Caballeronia mineralivorans]MEA3097142.1 transposase [Caballeronia mineralivorans]
MQRRLPNELGAILAVLAPHRDELAGVVVESTYNWYWLVDGLMDAGYRVHPAHVAAIKRYEGLKHSGDAADAAYLAQLLRLGFLPEGYIYPRERRAARDLARKRIQLVRCRTAQVVSIENLIARHTGVRPSCAQIKRLKTDQVDLLELPPDVALALKANLAIGETLQQQIVILEKRLAECVKLRGDYHLLKTVPGIGETLATVIMLETATVARFAGVGQFSSYCRCVDSVRQSNGRKKGEGNTRNGNAYLAWAFIEAANFALRQCPRARRFYERKQSATNRIVALKAVAHKLARACYYMLREQQAFDVTRCFV